mmetsp:Transcript_33117/g.74908  ORF Transcript_33117/g.74908 Transcript_33117/m.74908 type:complete len:366 (-) Transcript_33117:744-1841(-)
MRHLQDALHDAVRLAIPSLLQRMEVLADAFAEGLLGETAPEDHASDLDVLVRKGGLHHEVDAVEHSLQLCALQRFGNVDELIVPSEPQARPLQQTNEGSPGTEPRSVPQGWPLRGPDLLEAHLEVAHGARTQILQLHLHREFCLRGGTLEHVEATAPGARDVRLGPAIETTILACHALAHGVGKHPRGAPAGGPSRSLTIGLGPYLGQLRCHRRGPLPFLRRLLLQRPQSVDKPLRVPSELPLASHAPWASKLSGGRAQDAQSELKVSEPVLLAGALHVQALPAPVLLNLGLRLRSLLGTAGTESGGLDRLLLRSLGALLQLFQVELQHRDLFSQLVHRVRVTQALRLHPGNAALHAACRTSASA